MADADGQCFSSLLLLYQALTYYSPYLLHAVQCSYIGIGYEFYDEWACEDVQGREESYATR